MTSSLYQCLWHKNVFRSPSQRNCPAAEAMTPHFIPPTLWPSKSPHLNPKEYAVWGIMKSLQEDQGCWWTASTDWGGMGTTRPACDWRCDQTVVQESARLSMQMVDSLNILCDWHSDYKNGRHCHFLSVWQYCIDCIATCSALYSQKLIRLFIAKNIYYMFHKVRRQ